MGSSSIWPDGRAFAFTIMDDTDCARLHGVKPLYDALQARGLRTTKTVWGLASPQDDPWCADSLEDEPYRTWILDLHRDGFEIGWHGARSGGTDAPTHAAALEAYRDLFGTWPQTYANHAMNPECVYWGAERFDDPLLRRAYRRLAGRGAFYGSTPGSPYHWEDLCRERLQYVRGFTYTHTNTLRADPWMPYYDPNRPAVRRWFSSSDGSNVDRFVRLLAPDRIDALEREGGACIVYAHAAYGFVRDGKADPRVLAILDDLASRNVWSAPVSDVLDRLERVRGARSIAPSQHRRLEWSWAFDQFRDGRVLRR